MEYTEEEKPMHVIEFPIYKFGTCKKPAEHLDKVFRVADRIYTEAINESNRRLKAYKNDSAYKELAHQFKTVQEEYEKLEEKKKTASEKKKLAKEEKDKEKKKALIAEADTLFTAEDKDTFEKLKQRKKDLGAEFGKLREKYGIKKKFYLRNPIQTGVDEAFASKMLKAYGKNLTSMQIRSIIARVEGRFWIKKGRKFLRKNYKKPLLTISQGANDNGIILNLDDELLNGKKNQHGKKTIVHGTMGARPHKHNFTIRMDLNDEYVCNALVDRDEITGKPSFKPIRYCELKRRMFNNGWHYYISIIIEGPAPKKIPDIHIQRSADIGIDLGPSTVAYASSDGNIAHFEELAPNVKEKYSEKIEHYQRLYDKEDRRVNPDLYNEDGTKKKGKEARKIKRTNTDLMRLYQRKMNVLYRQKKDYVANCHNRLANQIIQSASTVYYEPVNIKNLQKKSKKTERSDNVSEIKAKDGTVKKVRKYKKKKRYGKSINEHSPATLITSIENHCKKYDIDFKKIDIYSYRASQYDPYTDTYKKAGINERYKDIGGHRIQRDLLSAFEIACPNEDLKSANREKLLAVESDFRKAHDAEVARQLAMQNMNPNFGRKTDWER